MRKKTVLYIITRSDVLGGASIHLIDLIKFSNKNHFSIHVVIGGNGIVCNILKNLPVCKIYSLKNFHRDISLANDLITVLKIRKIIRKLKPHIIHLHSAKAGVLGRVASLGINLKCYYTVHSWPFTDGISFFSKMLYILIEFIISINSTNLINVCRYDINLARNYLLPYNDKYRLIYNGVSAKNYFFSKKDYTIIKFVMVARFEVPKRQDLVIKALSKSNLKNVLITFIGDGPNLDHCKLLSKSLKVDNQIEYLGFVDPNEIKNHLQKHHIFLLITDREALPLTILEAMSVGLPIIASNVGGISEIFSPNSGTLINPKNVIQDLCSAFEYYLNNNKMITSQSNNSHLEFSQKFKLETMLNKTFNYYNL